MLRRHRGLILGVFALAVCASLRLPPAEPPEARAQEPLAECDEPEGEHKPKEKPKGCPPQTPPTSGAGFHPLDQRMIGDATKIGRGGVSGCSQEVHDLYVTTGPDGQTYRTWHALWHPKVKGKLVRWRPTLDEILSGKDDPECYFAHEHGQPPVALANPRSGAPLPAFGYAAAVERAVNPARTQIEPHPGFKVFTYLSGGRTGWRVKSRFRLNPDWDMEIMIHQGAPSLHLPENPHISTRVTQRFHEFSFWTSDGRGAVTHVIKMSNTGTAAFRGYSENGGRIIATAKEPLDEVWKFEGRVGDMFNVTFPAAILNPLNHFVGAPPPDLGGITNDHFDSSSETFGGLDVEALDVLDCMEHPDAARCQPVPFGSARAPVDGFMATVRTLDGIAFTWNNTTRQELFCTDTYGNAPQPGRCPLDRAGGLLQRVARIVLSRSAADPAQQWANVLTTDQDETVAFPVITDDPSRPWGTGERGKCKPRVGKSNDCRPRIPQDFLLGN